VYIGTRTNLIENVIANASGKFHFPVLGIELPFLHGLGCIES
jgi:hypothetical protein